MGLVTAGPAHATVLAAIHAASCEPHDRWDEAAMALLLASPGVYALIDPDGGCIMARAVADEAEILTLAVVPGSRRRGIGRRLLDQALEQAAVAGARTLFLEVSSANGPARSLYGAAGFARVGRRSAYYADRSDALILGRAIPA